MVILIEIHYTEVLFMLQKVKKKSKSRLYLAVLKFLALFAVLKTTKYLLIVAEISIE